MEKEYAELSNLIVDDFTLGHKKQVNLSILGTFSCFYIKWGKKHKLEFKKVRGRIGLTKSNIEDLIEKLREDGNIKKKELKWVLD